MKPENPKIVESFDDIEIYKKDALINIPSLTVYTQSKISKGLLSMGFIEFDFFRAKNLVSLQ
jgi:hypothetical protein